MKIDPSATVIIMGLELGLWQEYTCALSKLAEIQNEGYDSKKLLHYPANFLGVLLLYTYVPR